MFNEREASARLREMVSAMDEVTHRNQDPMIAEAWAEYQAIKVQIAEEKKRAMAAVDQQYDAAITDAWQKYQFLLSLVA